MGITHNELNKKPRVTIEQLREYKHCSAAWLMGRVLDPTEGYNAAEQAARMPQLARGEVETESDEEIQWEEEAGSDEEDAGAEEAER
jgi:hypothetical protein